MEVLAAAEAEAEIVAGAFAVAASVVRTAVAEAS